MTYAQLRTYCLSKNGATEDMPFGPDVVTFRVRKKMFALVSPDESPLTVNLKCDPELARILRRTYAGHVMPGYHMNKLHWNTVSLTGEISTKEIQNMIDDSYELVVGKVIQRRRPVGHDKPKARYA